MINKTEMIHRALSFMQLVAAAMLIAVGTGLGTFCVIRLIVDFVK